MMTESEMAKQIGQRLLQAMNDADMSRNKLAELTGFSETEVENWELGRAVLYGGEIVQLCLALGKTPHWLLGWDDQPRMQ
jgi:transcriptional regulator with XRE-family HTH domain